MARISGIDLPKEKRIETSLTYIYGIGRSASNKILKSAGVDPNTRTKNLKEEEVSRIAAVIQKEHKVEGDLRRDISQHIKRLIDVGSYRGFRHRRSLPARGQRTKSNARSRKGPRKTVGVTRKSKTQTPAAPPA